MGKKRQRTNKFPVGWDEARVRSVLAHYEKQSDEQAAAEDEAGLKGPPETIFKVPRKLVPVVRELIAQNGDE